MPDIRKADPKARRRTIALIAGAALIGGLVFYVIEKNRAKLESWLEQRVEFWIAHPEVIAFGAFVLMLPVIGTAIYLWRSVPPSSRRNAFLRQGFRWFAIP